MFINKLNQLYKPRRILYYIAADESDITAVYNGKADERFAAFTNAFGTYDDPGIFYIEKLGKPVIGIEYRPDDSRVEYPEGLNSIELGASFFYQVETDNDIDRGLDAIHELYRAIDKDEELLLRNSSVLRIKSSPDVIAVFIGSGDNKIRILYECRVDKDTSDYIINDDIEKLDKELLFRQAFFDPITGHYNWNHLVPCLEMPVNKGIDDYAFVHFDIKSFKVINEVYGHISANKVLNKIVNAMNNADFVYTSARCHNDNFAMMIKDMPEKEMTEKLQKFFDDLSHLDDDPNYTIYYRCGVVPMKRAVLSGNRVADAGKLAQALGTSAGKTDITLYTDKAHYDIMWSNYIKTYIDTAVENDEFIIYLQPKFDILSEQIKGAEALIRWNYKKKTFLSPGRFIPFFEKDGSIGKVDDIVLRKVCEALARWKKEGKKLYPISVNLSRSRLYDRDLIDHLTGIVDTYGVEHRLIDFELTESASYDDKARMIEVLNALRERGFKISMDDFGTGYSSLSLLTEMPLDTLKIDKSFVDKVGTDCDKDKDITVIKHIISLAKELDFVCLAEGAERKCQTDKLRELGCEVIQGYYYSKPIPLTEYEEKYL
jgi:EAL domain-containing protein (putative c-di-GMP-specific phosphodiesterase class I)/GGDEF domain-containing protein